MANAVTSVPDGSVKVTHCTSLEEQSGCPNVIGERLSTSRLIQFMVAQIQVMPKATTLLVYINSIVTQN